MQSDNNYGSLHGEDGSRSFFVPACSFPADGLIAHLLEESILQALWLLMLFRVTGAGTIVELFTTSIR